MIQMNLKPLLIGGIVAFFVTRKSATSKSKSVDNKPKVFIKPGYTITDCKIIKINDAEKALKQAFKYGANYKKPEDIDNCLFGGNTCRLTLIVKDPEIAKFFYDLSFYYLAGAVKENKVKVEDFSAGLAINREAFEKENISTVGWLTEKDIPAIIEKNK